MSLIDFVKDMLSTCLGTVVRTAVTSVQGGLGSQWNEDSEVETPLMVRSCEGPSFGSTMSKGRFMTTTPYRSQSRFSDISPVPEGDKSVTADSDTYGAGEKPDFVDDDGVCVDSGEVKPSKVSFEGKEWDTALRTPMSATNNLNASNWIENCKATPSLRYPGIVASIPLNMLVPG